MQPVIQPTIRDQVGEADSSQEIRELQGFPEKAVLLSGASPGAAASPASPAPTALAAEGVGQAAGGASQ